VFAVGRNHPVVRRSLNDVIDGGLADMAQNPAMAAAGPALDPEVAVPPVQP
jgi:hypothetical protein